MLKGPHYLKRLILPLHIIIKNRGRQRLGIDIIKYHTCPKTLHGKLTETRKHHIQESQEVIPIPAGDHKAAMNRHNRQQTKIEKRIHERNTALERSVKYFYWRNLTRFMVPTSHLFLIWIKTKRCLVCTKYP